MTLQEGASLAQVLLGDPTSRLAVAAGEWSHPATHEWLLLADLFDLTAKVGGVKRAKPYKRPWAREKNREQFGNTEGRSDAEVLEILQRFGHGTN